MKSPLTAIGVLIVLIALFGLTGGFFVLPETEQAIVTQFGQPVGGPITTAGLHLKVPFIQTVHRIEKRVLEWDGPSAEMPTKDKLYIIVDAFGRWRISDPLQFFLRLRDERSAQSRLDDILGSEMRNTIARHELVELIRTTKGRKPVQDETGAAAGSLMGTLPQIQHGRVALEDEIAAQARIKLQEFGLELLDIRFKRINYNPGVAAKIFDRMISERRQIAERFRSEGAGEAARILGNKEREMRQIASEAYRKVQGIQGRADAEATAIYAQAFNQSAQAREFYEFQQTLEVYRTALQRNTTVVLTTDSGLLRFLGGVPAAPVAPGIPQPPPLPQPPRPPALEAPLPAPAPALPTEATSTAVP